MTSLVIRIGLLTLVFASILSWVYDITEDQIAAQKAQFEEAQKVAALKTTPYDSPLIQSSHALTVDDLPDPATISLAYWDQKPQAALIEVVTPDGYSGDIRLLIALSYEGSLIGISVLEHRETPGLGDAIEASKSPWISQFNGESLATTPYDGWMNYRRLGTFDTISSATITSDAVITAIGNTLEAYQRQREQVWSPSP